MCTKHSLSSLSLIYICVKTHSSHTKLYTIFIEDKYCFDFRTLRTIITFKCFPPSDANISWGLWGRRLGVLEELISLLYLNLQTLPEFITLTTHWTLQIHIASSGINCFISISSTSPLKGKINLIARDGTPSYSYWVHSFGCLEDLHMQQKQIPKSEAGPKQPTSHVQNYKVLITSIAMHSLLTCG